MELVFSTLNVSSQQIDKLNNDELILAISKFPSLFANYKEEENLVKNLTINQRKVHQKYVSLLNNNSGYYEQEMYKSDILGWLRNREFQNVTVDKNWSINTALFEIDRLIKQNHTILYLIKKRLNEN